MSAINTGRIAQDVLDKGQADVTFVGRTFQRDPASVWTYAEDLGVKVHAAQQIEWAFKGALEA
ncbi:hypothetical protein EWM64_g10125 [Hericium alpestre]|uniref:NADH:flavin oxidoreductase/NADH oxidase N-terminal domain-containing protein n=1 Tax=Hericium alpestre TaxID=135208 RepID=A0A4Y9ZGJ1_9AGAM|nr:hypothetical protein EWM64_g10125 [Hericium alpestre]